MSIGRWYKSRTIIETYFESKWAVFSIEYFSEGNKRWDYIRIQDFDIDKIWFGRLKTFHTQFDYCVDENPISIEIG